MKKNILFFTIGFFMISCSTKENKVERNFTYPSHWWKEVSKDLTHSWEIPPQDAKKGEVILSKRNELGILSNFSGTPFIYKEKRYASIEGFWQMMKYPEEKVDGKKDLRSKWKLPFTREQVSQMVAFDAKKAGEFADAFMEKEKIDWVSFYGKKMIYCQKNPGAHYQLIVEAMREKLMQNQDVERILRLTGDLVLRPDHKEESCGAKEWKYYEIWMELRKYLFNDKVGV